MSADLHLHIAENDEILKKAIRFTELFCPYDEQLFHDISETPNKWIGEVSWLKAMIFEDDDTFIPNPVGEVSIIVGQYKIIDNELIKKIKNAMTKNNTTEYDVAEADDVIEFLKKYKGKFVFQVSW